MTHDQGSAMALHHKFSTDLKIDSYFGELHRPWQRGCNEVANGLVREFLPKGMNPSQVSHQQLTVIEQLLNQRPPKILNIRSPHQVFSALTLDIFAGVALQA